VIGRQNGALSWAVVGLIERWRAVQARRIQSLRVNPRASRTVPFVFQVARVNRWQIRGPRGHGG